VKLLAKMTSTLRSFWLAGATVADFRVEGSDLPQPVGEAAVLNLSAAWASLNLLVGTIASLPLMVYRDDGKGGREVAKDHPLYRLLHASPNAEQTTLDFWEQMGLSLELRGNAYAEIARIGSKVVSLSAIYPDVMQVRRINGEITYDWTDDTGARRRGTADEILHIRGFGGSPLGGLSALTHARVAFGLARDINTAAGKTFSNGIRPSGLLSFDKALTPEKRTELEKLLVDKFQGAVNAGRPMVLEAGGKWEQISLNPEDAQMLESRAFSVEEIARIFGVPPFMIGHTEKTTSWGTGIEQQVLGFQKFSLRRRLKRIELALMKGLLTPADIAQGVIIEFNVEGLLRGDSVARAKFYQAMLASGVMTINEVRALENLPPVEGGAVPRIQMQNVPITEATGLGQETAPSAEASNAQDA
jgi:HK97 family phage portal protein